MQFAHGSAFRIPNSPNEAVDTLNRASGMLGGASGALGRAAGALGGASGALGRASGVLGEAVSLGALGGTTRARSSASEVPRRGAAGAVEQSISGAAADPDPMMALGAALAVLKDLDEESKGGDKAAGESVVEQDVRDVENNDKAKVSAEERAPLTRKMMIKALVNWLKIEAMSWYLGKHPDTFIRELEAKTTTTSGVTTSTLSTTQV